MKRYLISALVLASVTQCFAFDITRYQDIQRIKNISVSQPAIVEINGLPYNSTYFLATDKGEAVQQQFQSTRKTKIVQPKQVVACIKDCNNAPSLADADESTTFDFPLVTSGVQNGTIKIVYAEPLETDTIVFRTTSDSYIPSTFTLTIDGKRVLNTMYGTQARFPKMKAQIIEIAFDYNQPIRFMEVGVGTVEKEVVTNAIRFVYQPNTSYVLYQNATEGREDTPIPAINLFMNKKEFDASLGDVEKNPTYIVKVFKEKDSDGDAIVDSVDNCPMQQNNNQADSNENGIGDVCDDYDYDGVPTYRDNCSMIINKDQMDKDRDGMGDVCDVEESRITEKYVWIPWLVFAVVFAGIMSMIYVTMKKK